mmetsp:Transcript_7934/g.19553  ORF Transcript_7934/g.19553 Transcript_7934/m.19553 type:complete len:116 (-) Transcript_7934:149-496(-)
MAVIFVVYSIELDSVVVELLFLPAVCPWLNVMWCLGWLSRPIRVRPLYIDCTLLALSPVETCVDGVYQPVNSITIKREVVHSPGETCVMSRLTSTDPLTPSLTTMNDIHPSPSSP